MGTFAQCRRSTATTATATAAKYDRLCGIRKETKEATTSTSNDSEERWPVIGSTDIQSILGRRRG